MESSLIFWFLATGLIVLFTILVVINYKNFIATESFQNASLAATTNPLENDLESYIASVIPLYSTAKVDGIFVKADFLKNLEGVLGGILLLTRSYASNINIYKLQVNNLQKKTIIVSFTETNSLVTNVQIYYTTGDTVKLPLIVAATSPAKVMIPINNGFIKLMNGTTRFLKLTDLNFPNISKNQDLYKTRVMDALNKGGVGFLLHGGSGLGKTQFIEYLLASIYKPQISMYELSLSYLDGASFATLEAEILSNPNSKIILSFGQKFDNLISKGERTPQVEELLEFLNKPTWATANKKLIWIAATNCDPTTLIEPWKSRFPQGDRLEFRALTALELEKYAKIENETLDSCIPEGKYNYYDLRSFV
jgi:hypothetical protein